jgi:hypothetical protein
MFIIKAFFLREGVVWLVTWGSKTITRLQDAPIDSWRVVKKLKP